MHKSVYIKQFLNTKQLAKCTTKLDLWKNILTQIRIPSSAQFLQIDDSFNLYSTMINTIIQVTKNDLKQVGIPRTPGTYHDIDLLTRLTGFSKLCAVWVFLIFSHALTAFSGVLCLSNGLLRNWNCHPLGCCICCLSNCHFLGLMCPNNFICSFLNCLFANHLPPRQPRA